MDIRGAVAWGLVLAACLAGCSGPEVTITHSLPAPVPLPEGGAIRPGRVVVEGPGEDRIPELLRAELAERMGDVGSGDGDDDARKADATVTVNVTVDSGHRPARRRDPETGELTGVELPYLVRKVEVRVVFAISAAGAGSPVELETGATYVSSEDPRVRGRYGLHRGDDPDRVPPTEQVVRELLVECVETARGMVAPLRMPVTLQFRYAVGQQAQAGLAAAKAGDFAAAAERFGSALEAGGESPELLFNLAAACEADGRLAAAEEHYRAALAASDGKDIEARRGAERVAKLRRRMSGSAQLGEAGRSP